jgi:E3 ubiquitin-protein ligase BRE1
MKEKSTLHAKVDQLSTQYHSLSIHSQRSESEIAKARHEVEQLTMQLESTRTRLNAALKQVDRDLCGTTKIQKTHVPEAPPIEVKVEETGTMDSNALKTIQEQLTVTQSLAERRLATIEKLEQEKIQLRDQADASRTRSMPSTNGDSDALRQAVSQAGLYKAEIESIKSHLDRALKETEEMRASIRKTRETIEAEEVGRRKVLETEMRRLEADLNRIRGSRDQMQQALELRTSKDQAEAIQNHEIRVIANTRKDRIVVLETEIQRLRMKLAAENGDRTGFDLHNEFSDEGLITELRQRLE